MFDRDKYKIERAITVLRQQKQHMESIKNSLPPKAQLRTTHSKDIESIDYAIEALELLMPREVKRYTFQKED